MERNYETPLPYGNGEKKDIKYFVRTTGERKFNYDIDYQEFVDKSGKPVESFIEQLKYISQYDSVFLEDDLILCRNFKERIEEVINKYPNDIINFFYRQFYYFPTHIPSYFLHNQCTYYPKGVALKVANKMEEIHNSLEAKVQYDVLEDMALKELGIRHIVYRPCLVQHKDFNSLIQKHVTYKRVTPFFIDYLNDLNIDYENCNTPYHLRRLNSKMQQELRKAKWEDFINGNK